jgi:diketogulonate reductase-like aldo/keto reductase
MNFVQANGAKIPAIGLGTMTLMDAVCVEAVETALRLGYRHVDTAERIATRARWGRGYAAGCAPQALRARMFS